MSDSKKSEVFSILQPDLLSAEELVRIIESRCCRAEKLRLMPKEGLVELFRRVVLPLPQRLYRTNRRGKMLTARRAKTGLGTERKEEGSSRVTLSRLKPPPETGNPQKLRLNSHNKSPSEGLDKIVIKDRRSSDDDEDRRKESKVPRSDSGRKITLKRSSEKPSSETPAENKKQRTAIKWP